MRVLTPRTCDYGILLRKTPAAEPSAVTQQKIPPSDDGGIPWQDFQDVVRTMLWEEVAEGISDSELAEAEVEVERIRELLTKGNLEEN